MRLPGAALFLAAAALAAADPAPPPPAAPDAVAAAKQDLADIHASAVSSEGAAALPNLNLPDVPLPSATAPSTLLTPDGELGPDGLKKKKEGTGNWLIDAMDKQAKADKSSAKVKDHDRDEMLKVDMDLLQGEDRNGTRPDKDAAALEIGPSKREEAEPTRGAYNPLDAFMGGWISAKDHDLLLPAKTEGEAAHGHAEAGLELVAGGPEGMLLAPEASGASDLKAGPNPYLAGFDLPSPPATINVLPAPPGQGFFPVDLGEPARAPVFSGADQRPPDSPHALIPDFAQPSEDDKYFPQLKKF